MCFEVSTQSHLNVCGITFEALTGVAFQYFRHQKNMFDAPGGPPKPNGAQGVVFHRRGKVYHAEGPPQLRVRTAGAQVYHAEGPFPAAGHNGRPEPWNQEPGYM